LEHFFCEIPPQDEGRLLSAVRIAPWTSGFTRKARGAVDRPGLAFFNWNVTFLPDIDRIASWIN
jgi:hypothetical protein